MRYFSVTFRGGDGIGCVGVRSCADDLDEGTRYPAWLDVLNQKYPPGAPWQLEEAVEYARVPGATVLDLPPAPPWATVP